MISEENKEITQLIEKLVTQKLDEHLKQKKDDSAANKASTVINVDNSSLLLAILYMINSKDNSGCDKSKPANTDADIENLIKQVKDIRKRNKEAYQEILTSLND
ncbi:hypothetical protein F9802_13050 [Bacillus aerolatus]|uniref:Uncharacterized protein n=1 Tax=Bacillus aerolatus TaxID=2653354 RepID=A0A6I1FE60_9BACI|nr:hypothetical protein [Bacillus aerolatus]KAB7705987.1 hypothetical protein F9802_13050 [Bacillus aerolatus]